MQCFLFFAATSLPPFGPGISEANQKTADTASILAIILWHIHLEQGANTLGMMQKLFQPVAAA